MMKLKPGDVLFVDEIHRLPPAVSESLYGAMEGNEVSWFTDAGVASQKMSLSICPWTLVSATTRPGMLSRPLVERFACQLEMEPYDLDAMVTIAARSASKLGLQLSVAAVKVVATRARDTPRVVNKLLGWLRDVSTARDWEGTINAEDVSDALHELGFDHIGLDSLSQRYLAYLVGARDPVGLNTIAASLGAATDTIQDQVEPFLLRRGLVKRTPRGRQATIQGRKHVRGR
jgi:Holliday junction DNA helicase RuvB